MQNLIFAFFTSLFLILPDFITNIFYNGLYTFTWYRFSREALATFLIALILSFTPKKFALTVIGVFLTFLAISSLHFIYFHTFLMPFEVKIITNFDDTKDIFYSLSDILPAVLIFIGYIIVALIFLNWLEKKLNPKKAKVSVFIFILALIVYPYFIHKKENIYLANFTHLSYFNTLNTLYLAFLQTLKPKPHHNYKPYIVKKVDNGKPIVVMIMGESVNYKRLHLYGFNVNNTPNLDKLKNDKNFIYKKAISSSVRTICSVTTFFYNKREPDNINLLLNNKTNIMKLAKENGYDTYWLSMQSDVSLISKIINFANHKVFEWQLKRKYDDELIKYLKKIPFNKKTFVVIHLKAIHGPYNKWVPKEFRIFKGKRGGYYNGVYYNDYVISQIIDYFKKNHKNFVIYFTSDHGEMLGFKNENFRHGHSQLVLGDTYVPFFYYSDKYHKNLNKKFYNHYQISKMLTRDLGYEIINPNNDKTYYINGTEIDGSAGWIHYKFDNGIKIIKKVTF
jgi:glucan phosphoethanolaminetransferase (alkaline phosphatase superfamily)